MSFLASQADVQALLNVTADSLARYCGLTGDQHENSLYLERQVRSISTLRWSTTIHRISSVP